MTMKQWKLEKDPLEMQNKLLKEGVRDLVFCPSDIGEQHSFYIV